MENARLYVLSMEKKCFDMRETVGAMVKGAVDRTDGLLGQLKLELSDLRRRDAELEDISLLENPMQFIKVITRLVLCVVFCVSLKCGFRPLVDC